MSIEAREIGRVADAIFAVAKSHRESVKLADRQTDIQEELLELQIANLAVTKALEEQLIRQQTGQLG